MVAGQNTTLPEEVSMTAAHGAAGAVGTTGPASVVSGLFTTLRSAFQAWRKHEKVRADLHGLSDRELADIGIARGEVDVVAATNGSYQRR
jgi:uncharacterized protein YjiS (DUF1127 family)